MSILDRIFAPSPARYAAKFMATLKAAGDNRPWRYDTAQNRLLLVGEDGETPQNVVNLSNMFAEYVATPRAQRADALSRQAKAMMAPAMPDDFTAARGNLLPVIRLNAERHNTALSFDDQEAKVDIAHRPFCENLEIGLAYDTEFAIARIPVSQLEKWGVTFDDALDIAIMNLREISTKPFTACPNGVFLSAFDDSYDVSRILLTDLLHRQGIAGAPVVMIPNRGKLLLTGDQSDKGMAAIVQYVERVLDEPRSLSPLLLRYVGNRWAPYAPPLLAARLHLYWVKDQARTYEDQQKLLRQRLERQNQDIFVASYMAMQRPDGSVLSMCSWTENVHSLLPKTEFVNLVRLDTKEVVQLPWDELMAACGEMFRKTEYMPERYEVSGFPPDEMFRGWLQRQQTTDTV
ncbi:MAG: DUF1444 family protein [Burkholderiales bacterium]|nr:DUF1444 family protein [Burkholderiales bacterium]